MASHRWVIALVLVIVPAMASHGQEILKDGKLTHPLKIVQLQGGFAGFTGEQWSIAPDGAWVIETLINQQRREKSKGNLSTKQLAELGDLLTKADLANLPKKAGMPVGANPHSVELTFGERTMTFTSQTPPKLDPRNPKNVESRFAAVWLGTGRILSQKK